MARVEDDRNSLQSSDPIGKRCLVAAAGSNYATQNATWTTNAHTAFVLVPAVV